MYICIHICVYMYIYTYIHTYLYMEDMYLETFVLFHVLLYSSVRWIFYKNYLKYTSLTISVFGRTVLLPLKRLHSGKSVTGVPTRTLVVARPYSKRRNDTLLSRTPQMPFYDGSLLLLVVGLVNFFLVRLLLLSV